MSIVLRVLFITLISLAASRPVSAQRNLVGASSELTSPLTTEPQGATPNRRINSSARRIPLEIGAMILHYAFWGGIAVFNETVLDTQNLTAVTFSSVFALGLGSLLTSGMVFTVGESAGGNGKFWATLLGSEIGRIVFATVGLLVGGAVQSGTRDTIPGFMMGGFALGCALGPIVGAILGYELSQTN